MQLEGRVAIVTGAGDGTGAAVARRFAAEGASALVAEVNEETGRATADEIGGGPSPVKAGTRLLVTRRA
ncbi:SDR family NAD(P)-dependent oxidoreductase [Streptomyces sp. NPDC058330]|uniref:SDR family NAD(P)-dependent oxidoreductase n=1 Tax=Streptomyces sp. NPDC058330 TaxID=3346449 RepID=UPI0036E3F2D0